MASHHSYAEGVCNCSVRSVCGRWIYLFRCLFKFKANYVHLSTIRPLSSTRFSIPSLDLHISTKVYNTVVLQKKKTSLTRMFQYTDPDYLKTRVCHRTASKLDFCHLRRTWKLWTILALSSSVRTTSWQLKSCNIFSLCDSKQPGQWHYHHRRYRAVMFLFHPHYSAFIQIYGTLRWVS